MILYFSATGNSKFVAQTIASQCADVALSVTEVGNKITLKEGEQLGIVTPTYYWVLPSFVEDFLRRLIIENYQNNYVFCISTYGSTCGQTDYYVKRQLAKKGVKLNASFAVKTVDNWTVGYSVKDEQQIQQTLQSEWQQIQQIIPPVVAKQSLFNKKDKKSLFMCQNAKYFYNKARKTSHLHLQDNCIGCGLCAQNCPVGAIKVQNGKATWVVDKCTMCFACLHRCPQNAINYDNKTQNNGQYLHPQNTDYMQK